MPTAAALVPLAGKGLGEDEAAVRRPCLGALRKAAQVLTEHIPGEVPGVSEHPRPEDSDVEAAEVKRLRQRGRRCGRPGCRWRRRSTSRPRR